ncbi:hypothetical protein BaRGS_00038461 [Batillaria attramentaria]|uniref:Fido domain-containing protein n=1 Tax=Batillaria attramentaria TaxID=370345 RepID=A0ABD0J6C4_9CAEN
MLQVYPGLLKILDFALETSTKPSLEQILEYQRDWKHMSETCGNSQKWKECHQNVSEEFCADFLSHIAKEEDIGLKDKGAARALVESTNREVAQRTRVKRMKSQEETETRNLLQAWEHLSNMAEKEAQSDPNTLGLLEIDSCVKEVHKILLQNIKCGTTPGHFSTRERYTELGYNGERHYYPKFETEEDAEKHVLDKIDTYNALVSKIKEIQHPLGKISMLFKCAAWILFEVISLHPFGNGNGRLCRMLCSYCLAVFTPFPTPIYNVYSTSTKEDYINAIVETRKSKPQHPVQLATLIIDSNCKAWEKFIQRMREELSDSENSA